ncbi:MAG: YggU family protein [Acidobacteria bacterium]|nr:YggU family protein [Acidobacteriota bacterium]
MNLTEHPDGIVVAVRVIPRASRSEIVGEHDGSLKVRICSPPVDGAANAEIIRLFAKHFGVSKSEVSIISGETSKNKRIKIENLSVSKFEELIK